MKKLLFKQRSDFPHWVGDGFPVRSIFSYYNVPHDISPFLLLDYAGPTEFPPTDKVKGVGEHPHRGFETVTIVYDGEVEHRDSSGGGGIIRKGDVQWMTAASGLVHEERHGKEYAKTGGPFEMVQLWVNLPKKYKMTSPRYQGIRNESIPVVQLPDSGGLLRVIAGEYESEKGPAKTFSPVNIWDIRLKKNKTVTLRPPVGHAAAVFVLSGQVKLADGHIIKDAEVAFLTHEEAELSLEALSDAKILFLGGEPLNEPLMGYGPFVMNEQREIYQAFKDYEEGKMGVLTRIEGAE